MANIEKTAKHAVKAMADANPAKSGPLSGAKGVVAGVVAAALVPAAGRGVARVAGPKLSELGDEVRDKVGDLAPDGVGDLLPDMPDLGNAIGGDEEDEGGEGGAAPGHGSGRRMPVQQAVDIAAPIKEVYNAWTQFEDWPEFMHRLESVEQLEDAKLAFQSKFWGIRRRFQADIIEQRPDQRIEWDVSDGVAHTGVVTFHRLSERLTRVEVTLDIEPHGIVEKAGRGWRFAKRGIRGDLHRFKAHVELSGEPVEGWRGTIKDGTVERRTERKRTTRARASNSNGSKANGSKAKSSGTRAAAKS
jgi:uncharacterized membrane protein